LERVGIPEAEKRFGSYPFEFSGGMRQRVMIAIALANRPQLVIADEPTTALDVTIQAQVLSLLDELRQELDMSLILITHDLGVSTNICDRTVVMYGSRVMETSATDSFVNDPWHPYSVGLMGSTLEITNVDRPLTPIPGQSPSAMDMPSGCPFHPRCFWALEHVNVSPGSTHPCVVDVPQPREVAPNHLAACHFAEEVHEYVSAND
jgi:oligopeptide/dipeptide ABC transporter ATP-binding protein